MPVVINFRHESATANLTLWEDETATVSSVYAKSPRKGHGRALMGLIEAYADVNGLVLILVARKYGNHRGLDNAELVEFYKKFGFVLKFRGREGTLMIRKPQDSHTL